MSNQSWQRRSDKRRRHPQNSMENGKSRGVNRRKRWPLMASFEGQFYIRTNKRQKTDLITQLLQLQIPLEISTSDDLNAKSENRVTNSEDLNTKSVNRVSDFEDPGTNSGTRENSNINSGRLRQNAAIDVIRKLKLV